MLKQKSSKDSCQSLWSLSLLLMELAFLINESTNLGVTPSRTPKHPGRFLLFTEDSDQVKLGILMI